jgi:chaperonin GroEL
MEFNSHEIADQNEGVDILKKAIQSPFRSIMENAGLNADVVWHQILGAHKEHGDRVGFDARNEKITDMFEAGIIDPVKVTRVALEKAASVAGTMLITECTVTNIPSDDAAPAMNPMAGMGM